MSSQFDALEAYEMASQLSKGRDLRGLDDYLSQIGVNSKDESIGTSILFWASVNCDYGLLGYLLSTFFNSCISRGIQNIVVDINIRTNSGGSALIQACYLNSDSLAIVLVEAGADIHLKCQGKTAIQWAGERHPTLAARLEELFARLQAEVNAAATGSADHNTTNEFGVTLLMRAVQFHMTYEAVALIERGVGVSATTTYGATALTLAVTGDHNESVELLLNYRGDPSQLIDPSQGTTALHRACAQRNLEMCKTLLLRLVAEDVQMLDHQDRTALDCWDVREDKQGRTDLVAFMETLFSSTTDLARSSADDDSHITTTDAFSELSLLEIGPSVDCTFTTPETTTSVTTTHMSSIFTDAVVTASAASTRNDTI